MNEDIIIKYKPRDCQEIPLCIPDEPDFLNESVLEGLNYLKNRNLAFAIDSIQKGLSKNNYIAYAFLGFAYNQINDFKSGLDNSQNSLNIIDRTRRIILGDKVSFLRGSGIIAYQALINSANALITLGQIEKNQSKIDQAKNRYMLAINLFPEIANAYYSAARHISAVDKGNEECRFYFEQARKYSPNNPDIEISFGEFEFRLGNEEKGLEMILKACKEYLDHPRVIEYRLNPDLMN